MLKKVHFPKLLFGSCPHYFIQTLPIFFFLPSTGSSIYYYSLHTCGNNNKKQNNLSAPNNLFIISHTFLSLYFKLNFWPWLKHFPFLFYFILFYYLLRWTLALLSRLECTGMISAHCNLCLLCSSNSPTSAFSVPVITGARHHAQLIFLYF